MKSKNNYQNSKALFVMKIIAMSFAILAVVVFVTVTLYKWIAELNAKIKNSQTRIAKISARLNRLRKARVKHILKLRRAQKKADRKRRKSGRKNGQNNSCGDCNGEIDGNENATEYIEDIEDIEDIDELDELDDIEDIDDIDDVEV